MLMSGPLAITASKSSSSIFMIELNPGSNTVQSSPSGFPQVSQPDPSDPDYEYQLETFQTIDDILTDIETILDILEVFINGADFLKYWVLG